MEFKKYLENLIDTKKKDVDELRSKIKESKDADEVRALGVQLDKVLEEQKSAEKQLIEANATDDEKRFNPVATYGAENTEKKEKKGIDCEEYRTAFMELVLRGKKIPKELRADENTLTTDVASVIPSILVNRIIERMDECGMILPLVTRTSYAAGIVIPTSSVKPVASWVAEGEGSDKQKKTTGKITFSYFKLRCEISMSMEVGTMALAAFEAKFVENVSKAMVIAIEKAILMGDGLTQPKGIMTETPDTADKNITLAGAEPTYKELVAIESAIPVEYEGTAKWFMTKKQFGNILGITDNNKQPIARVNYGIDGKLERTIFGRQVILHPYADEMGEYMAGIFDFNDYILNTIYDLGISKKQDWDTEDLLTKAVMSVDGKAVDVHSLILVKAGA